MREWQARKLSELGTVERGRSRHRPRNDPVLYSGAHPFVQTGDVKAAGLRLFNYSQTYSDAGLAQSRMWPKGTLCITIAANIGDTAILGIPACFPDSIVGFTPFSDVSNVVFVKYALDFAKQRLTAISHGATQDNLSLEKLLSLDLPIPPVETQRRIAAILGAYDDLIEVNRRRVVVLEEMARALFEEWFIRFRFPGHDAVPLHDTPDGPLPLGWRYGELGEQIELPYGKALKATDRQSGPFAVIGSSGIVGEHTEAYEKGPGIVVGRKGNVGAIIWSPNDFWPIDTVFFVRSTSPLMYLLQLLRRVPFQNTDAAVPGLNRSAALKKAIRIPPVELTEEYHRLVWPMQRMVDELTQINQRLAVSRDLLLPRLMSGRLSMADAQKELELA